MSLEDHVGDMLRKSRAGLRVSVGQVVPLSGLSEEEYLEFEETGQSPRLPNFARLGPFLALDPRRLSFVYAGWLPASVDLGRWREFRQISTTENGNTVHCYLIWDEATREAALFDTGWNPEPVFQVLADQKLELVHLFITHLHHDHVAGLTAIRARFPGAQVHTNARSAPAQQRNQHGECISVGGLRITNRETPGHAEEGATYVISGWPLEAPSVAVVGDTIFAGSIGGAPDHFALARQKIREQILSLPADTLLCPGHGPLTTVIQERNNNPFF
jgi:glyoxylase-like metal-dependent hydrolase (beta-lactamase superfamily II)